MLSRFERAMKIFEYNGAVDLSRCSQVPSIREYAERRAKEIAEELGWI